MPRFNYQSILDEEDRRRDLLALGAGDPQANKPAGQRTPIQDREFFGLGDLAMALPRGIEGAVQDIYGLGDAVLGDILPDYDSRFLGESDTTVGGVVEGISNFLIPFVGVYGKLGKVTKLGAIARGATAGAVVDFAAFDGHESRLSDLVELVPALQNPITEYLASDPNDTEIEGRFKNTVEGLALGGAIDGLLLGLKRLRAGRSARAAGDSPEAVQKAMDDAVPESELEAALGKPVDEPAQDALQEAAEDPDLIQAKIDEYEARTPESILKEHEISDDDVRELINREFDGPAKTNPRHLAEEGLLDEGPTLRQGLNYDYFQAPEDAFQVIRKLQNDFADEYVKRAKTDPQTFGTLREDALEQYADFMGIPPEQALAKLKAESAGLGDELANINAKITAVRYYYNDILQSIGKKIDEIKHVPQADNPANLYALKRQMILAMDVDAGLRGASAQQGRGLVSNRMPAFADLSKAELDEAIAGLGGAEHIKKFADKFKDLLDEGNLTGAAKFLRPTRTQMAGKMTMEYWINALLSGPLTHSVNALSGALTSVYRPLEALGGGLIGYATGRSGMGDVISDTLRELHYMWDAAPEAFRLAKTVAKDGENILQPQRRVFDYGEANANAITGDNLEYVLKGTEGSLSDGTKAAVDWLGAKLIRKPSDLLAAGDEFFKQINYRARMRSDLTSRFLKEGLPAEEAAEKALRTFERLTKTGEAASHKTIFRQGLEDAKARGITNRTAAKEHAEAYVKANFDEGLSKIAQDALSAAEEATHTQALQAGTLGASIQQLVVRHPMLRFLALPFIRTPINLLKYAGARMTNPLSMGRYLMGARTPAGREALQASHNRLIQDMLSSDPRRKAEAIGRTAMGGMITMWGLKLAYDQDGPISITGRGPKDPETRRVLQDAGWQEYSFKMGDSYVSYKRLDPFATLLGTFADVADYGRYAGEEDQGAAEELFVGLMVGVTQNLTNKSYVTGLQNLFDVVSDPTVKMPTYVNRMAGSFVPAAAAQSLPVFGDENFREIQSMLDAGFARIPGLSDKLPPLRNMFGEPIVRPKSVGSDSIGSITNLVLPLAYSETTDSVVKRELKELKHGFQPPRKTIEQVDLSEYRSRSGQTAYDRWSELHGSVKLNGRTMQNAMRELILSRQYQALPQDAAFGLDSPRIREIFRVLQRYRRAAFQQMLKEFPELRARHSLTRRVRSELGRGNDLRALLQN